MKKENADAAENMENLPDQQNSAESKKLVAKPPKVRKKEKEVESVRLPFLVEFTYTISTILLILFGLTVIGISFITGASLLNLVIRTSVAILVMGSLLMLISSQISSGVLSAILLEQEENDKSKSEESENAAKIEDQSTGEA